MAEPADARAKRGELAVHALVLFATLIIATAYPVGKAITYGLDPAALTLVRFALAAAIFAPVVGLRYGLAFPGWRAVLRYAAISAPLVGFFWCMFEALRTTSALNTAALFTLVPGLSALFAALLVRERLGASRLVALALGMVGALWVVFRGDPARLMGLAFNVGDLVFLIGVALMSLYGVAIKGLYRGEPTSVMTLWVMITGTGWLLLAVREDLWLTPWATVAPAVWLGIAYLAVFSTVVTFFLIQYATLVIGPTRVQAYTYLAPALVILIEGVAGGQWPSLMTVPGVVIVLGASLVVQRGALGRSGAGGVDRLPLG